MGAKAVKRPVLSLVVGLSLIGCKPKAAESASSLQTLDSLAGGKAVACTLQSHHEGQNYLRKVDGYESLKPQAQKALITALQAVPQTVLDEYFAAARLWVGAAATRCQDLANVRQFQANSGTKDASLVKTCRHIDPEKKQMTIILGSDAATLAEYTVLAFGKWFSEVYAKTDAGERFIAKQSGYTNLRYRLLARYLSDIAETKGRGGLEFFRGYFPKKLYQDHKDPLALSLNGRTLTAEERLEFLLAGAHHPTKIVSPGIDDPANTLRNILADETLAHAFDSYFCTQETRASLARNARFERSGELMQKLGRAIESNLEEAGEMNLVDGRGSWFRTLWTPVSKLPTTIAQLNPVTAGARIGGEIYGGMVDFLAPSAQSQHLSYDPGISTGNNHKSPMAGQSGLGAQQQPPISNGAVAASTVAAGALAGSPANLPRAAPPTSVDANQPRGSESNPPANQPNNTLGAQANAVSNYDTFKVLAGNISQYSDMGYTNRSAATASGQKTDLIYSEANASTAVGYTNYKDAKGKPITGGYYGVPINAVGTQLGSLPKEMANLGDGMVYVWANDPSQVSKQNALSNANYAFKDQNGTWKYGKFEGGK